MKTTTALFSFIFAVAITALIPHYAYAQWETQNSTTTDTLDCVSFVDVNTGYALGCLQSLNSTNNILLKTTDGGIAWTKLNFKHIGISVFFTDANNGYISGWDSIFKTTNGGVDWSVYPTVLGNQTFLFSIYFFNSSIGFATALDGNTLSNKMLRTTNGGVTWTPINGGTTATTASKSIFCTDANTCYVVGWNANRGINKTIDGGLTWSNIANPSLDCTSVFFTNSTTGVVVGGSKSLQTIFRTTNGGNNWTQVYNENGGMLTSVCFTDANNGFAVGGEGRILETNDAGVTWNTMTSPTTKTLKSVHFPTSSIGFAVGNTGTIIKYDLVTKIEELNKVNDFLLFPNPTTGVFRIINNKFQMIGLEIYNAFGEKVYSTKKIKQQISPEINLTNSPKGIYFVKIYDGENIYIEKIVIQ